MVSTNYVQNVGSLFSGDTQGKMAGQFDQAPSMDSSDTSSDHPQMQQPDGISSDQSQAQQGQKPDASSDQKQNGTSTERGQKNSSTDSDPTASLAENGSPVPSGDFSGGDDSHGKNGNADPFTVAVTYLTISGAFAVITGYIEMLVKFVGKRRKKNSKES